jgi:hypothetical protein
MSSISLSLKMMLAVTACAGFTLLACGDETSGGGDDEEEDKGGEKDDDDKPKKDAGKADSGKKDSSISIPQGVPGEDCSDSPTPVAQCTGCGSAICTTRCGDDETWGECTALTVDAGNPISNILGDGGGIKVSDAGVSVMLPGSDASVDIPATECPDTLTCNDIAAAFSAFGVPPIKFCTASGSLTPPECTNQQDCTDMGLKIATCMAIPGLSTFVPGTFCLSSCK